MDPVIDNIHTVNLVFSVKVRVKARFNVLDDGMPGVGVIDKVAKAGSIYNGQAKTNTIFFNIGAYGFDLDCLWHELVGGPFALLWGVEGGIEECVDEGGFSEPRFP